MRKSTKILFVIFIISLIGLTVSFSFLFSAISLTNSGLEINMTTMSYISFSFLALTIVLGIWLYVRFLKTRRFSGMLFFSTVPLTLIFATSTYFLTTIDNYKSDAVGFIKVALKVGENKYNTLLWVIAITIVYFVLLYLIFKSLTKPIRKIEKSIADLADGNIKNNIDIGGNKQFATIEHYLNKINKKLKQKALYDGFSTTGHQNNIPKQFIKLFNKKSITEISDNDTTNAEISFLFCEVRSFGFNKGGSSSGVSFDNLSTYNTTISQTIKKHNGYIFKSTNEGVLAMFISPKDAILCGSVIVNLVNEKNKQNLNLPAQTVGISLTTKYTDLKICDDDDEKFIKPNKDIEGLLVKMNEINRQYGSIIIFSDSVLCNEQTPKLNYRYIGNLNESGDSQIEIYEYLDIYEKAKQEKLIRNKVAFEQGVYAYFNGKFDQAKSIFEKVYKQEKNDRVCYTYFNKCCDKT